MHNNDKSNIILTGFMGTGKTTVGTLLARKLNRQFIDTDHLIETRQGLTIPEIFVDLGESAFRQMEADIAQELAQKEGLVVSTGGRFMLNPANVEALSGTGRIFCLVASPQEIIARLTKDKDNRRPLLNVPNPSEQIRELLQERKKGYQRFLKLATDGRQPVEVMETLLAFLKRNPQQLTIDLPEQPYHCLVGSGILPFTRHLAGAGSMSVVITDTVVGKLYSQSCGAVDHIITIPAEGRQKTMATVQSIYDQLLDIGFDGFGTIVALGGSVVGDIAGFVAATFMHGVNLVQCPTSLLAMADTSIGGKNSIDVPQGKNLIGSFKQPSVVIADVATLATLPREELLSGMAEVIKHGLLADTELLQTIERTSWPLKIDSQHAASSALQTLVAQAIQVKISFVQKESFDQGARSSLNLGQSFAHAIEKVSERAIRHGEAVAMGLVAAADLSARLGHCGPQLKQRIESVLKKVGLPHQIPAGLSPESIHQAMGRDKKKPAQSIPFVLPVKVGRVVVADNVPAADILKTLAAVSSTTIST